jgi:hypothetical protein
MEEAGDVRRVDGHYLAASVESHHSHWQPLRGNNHHEQPEQLQTMHRDVSDYVDYTDDADDRSYHPSTEVCYLSEATTVHEAPESFSVCEDVGERLQASNKNELTVINRHQCNQRNHCNHLQPQTAVSILNTSSDERGTTTQEEHKEPALDRNRCPHHPRAHLVRFDPAGQAWCEKLECWDCFRLMKIGEALDYRCLTDLGGKVVIEEGIVAWSDFVRGSRAFLVVVATEQAIAMCKSLDIEVPDVSDEVKRLVEVRPAPS